MSLSVVRNCVFGDNIAEITILQIKQQNFHPSIHLQLFPWQEVLVFIPAIRSSHHEKLTSATVQ